MQNRVNDQLFARLCSILHHNMFNSSKIGIFFIINGALGFPKKSANGRSISLRAARLRQVVFMAKCNKPILAFDLNDISQLAKSGSLFNLICNKIKDVEQLSGIYMPDVDQPNECDLPDHLNFL